MRRASGWLAAVALVVLAQGRSEAGLIFSLQQVGPDVVLTGSGTINLAGVPLLPDYTNIGGFVEPIGAGLFVAGPGSVSGPTYGPISGPASFGAMTFTLADSGTGDKFGLFGGPPSILQPPAGYVSGTPLSGAATFTNTTFALLGVTPGVYTWTWGSGASADSAVLYAGLPEPVVPEPATLALLGLGAAGLVGARRRRRRA